MRPTPEQRLAIDTPGARVAVVAGAGSGKTTMLVQAVWEDLDVHGVAPEELLAASYNRSAAAHLADRLQRKVAAERGPARAALDVSAGWVGTLHALCARVVREHPFAACVDPGFVEIDEAEAAALFDAALDEALEATNDPGFTELLTHATGAGPVRDAIRQAHARLRTAGMEVPRLRPPDPPPDQAPLVARLEAAARAIAESPLARDDHRAEAEAARRMIAEPEERPSSAPKGNRNCARALKPLVEEFNEAAEALFAARWAGWADAQLAGFAAALAATADAYEARKRRAGALDFEDLELAARRVLRAGRGPRLSRVYVDEFQDTNPLQDELVTLLAAERTMVVGDACQAIYGFRHADPTRFLERVRADPAASLRDNHRSDPRLLDALNGWLELVLDDQPGFARLEAAATGTGPAVAPEPAELVRVVPPEGRGRAGRVAEAAVVAGEVATLLERGYAPRDIAVLFRAITEVEPYRAALSAGGIAYHVVAGSGFLAHDQVADAVALLRVLENPHDEPALVRVLASPYVAASDEALVGLREAAGRGAPLWPAARPAVGALVGDLRALRRSSGLAGLVDRVVGARGYDLAVLGLEDGPRRFANLRKLVRMAASFEAVRGPDLRAFLRMLEDLEERRQDPGEAVLVDPSLDAVRLATVHGVKGQEFPAVVLADASHGIPGASPIVLVAPDGRAGIRAQRRDGKAIATPAFAELQTGLSRAAEAEERRLAYVALTRAARHAVVVGRHLERGSMMAILGTPLEGVDDGVALLGEGLVRVRTVTAAEAAPAGAARVSLRELTSVSVPAIAAPPEADRLAGRSLSFSALESAQACGLRLHLVLELGLEPGPDLAAQAPRPDGWPAHALGAIVHERLERHRFGDPPPPAGWAAAAAREAGLGESPSDAARAEGAVAALLASPLSARIAAGTAVAERPFAVAVDGVLIRGVMDLHVTESAGRALVVDWKTHRLDGRLPADEMPAYRLQQAIYGLAALRAGAAAAELRWVFLEALDDPQVRTVGPGDLPALVAEVREVLEALRSSQPVPAAVTPQAFCAGCPGLRALCPAGHRQRGAGEAGSG